MHRHSMVKMLDGSELDGPPPLRRASTIDVGSSDGARHTPSPPLQPRGRLTRRASLDDLEQESCQLTPRIEGRIVVLDEQVL